MGSKRRQCCNVAAWGFFYLICIPLLVTYYKGHIKKARTISKAAEKLNIYGNITSAYDTVQQEINGLRHYRIMEKLPVWQNRSRLNTSEVTETNLMPFRQIMTQDDYEILMGLLRKLKHICEENALTYMLCGGSLLGTYRHGGFVPWDDDIDVWLDYRQLEKAKNILNSTGDIILYRSAYTKNLWKMSNSSRKTHTLHVDQDYRFPYIDVYFFTGNSTHMFDTEITLKERTTVLIDDIFPLRKALFEDEEFYVPNKILTVIEKMYGSSEICTSQDFTHRYYLENKNIVSVPCKQLYKYYPFITRSYVNDTVIETLTFMNETIRRTVSNIEITSHRITHGKFPEYPL